VQVHSGCTANSRQRENAGGGGGRGIGGVVFIVAAEVAWRSEFAHGEGYGGSEEGLIWQQGVREVEITPVSPQGLLRAGVACCAACLHRAWLMCAGVARSVACLRGLLHVWTSRTHVYCSLVIVQLLFEVQFGV
jgi:hypothetical protein